MLIEEIEERRSTAEELAQGFMDQLERDIATLQRRTTELEKSLNSEDHLHLLQTISSQSPVSPVISGNLLQSISGIPEDEVLALRKVEVQRIQILMNTYWTPLLGHVLD